MHKFSDKNEANRKQYFYSEGDDYALLRTHMRQFAEKIVEDVTGSNKKLNVLEVGPSSNVYPESDCLLTTSIISAECKRLGHNYKTLDICGTADYICSIEEASKHVVDVKFDVVVLLGVIEHVGNIHLLSNEFSKITNDNAKIYVNTPYMFKIHGPIPDYWRISQYGYEHLFGKQFNLDINTYPHNELGKNSFPLSYNVLMTKKQ